jgi:hypothetical protein
MKKTGFQEDLFGEPDPTPVRAVVAVPAGAAPLSPAQRTFNRLTERIRRGRERLAAWDAFLARLPARVVAELQPVEQEVRAAQRRLVGQLQALLGAGARAKGERLTGRLRQAARSLLLEVVSDLLQDGPDADLEALHDRYSDVSFAEEARQELQMAEMVLGQVFGDDVARGHEASNVDEFLEHTAERLAAQHAEARQRAASARRSSRATRLAEQKAQAAHEASASVREIYRKLASALHPDREADPNERERKTALLQRANRAYEHDDLLELLSLQIEVEQIDPAALANLPETRLRHYNQVLLEQARTLDAQLVERAAMFATEFRTHPRNATPEDAERGLRATIAEARAQARHIARFAERLEDPLQRRAALEELAAEQEDEMDRLGLAVLLGAPPPPARRRKRNKRKRKKR